MIFTFKKITALPPAKTHPGKKKRKNLSDKRLSFVMFYYLITFLLSFKKNPKNKKNKKTNLEAKMECMKIQTYLRWMQMLIWFICRNQLRLAVLVQVQVQFIWFHLIILYSHEVIGALDKYIWHLPPTFSKKNIGFLYHKKLWVMTACRVLCSGLIYFWRNMNISSIICFSKSPSINTLYYTVAYGTLWICCSQNTSLNENALTESAENFGIG